MELKSNPKIKYINVTWRDSFSLFYSVLFSSDGNKLTGTLFNFLIKLISNGLIVNSQITKG